jgi:hypothetical protein
MKRILLVATSFAFTASVAVAEHNMAGCGLGSQVFEGKNDQTSQILAATTNGTSGNQTFGISSGTLGCTPDGAMASKEELNIFTGKNLQKLAADIAKGEGEAIETFVQLKGVQASEKASYIAKLQSNFGNIFTSENITAGEVLANIEKLS